MDVSQEQPSFAYRDPTNAVWDDQHGEGEHILLFYPEVMVPRNLPCPISPFVVTVHNHRDIRDYQKWESGRRNFKDKQWPALQRLYVHFENGNLDLLRKEARALSDGLPNFADNEELGSLVMYMTRYFFDLFVADPKRHENAERTVAFAYTKSEKELRLVASTYVQSGRMAALWKELKSVRQKFMSLYESLLPLLMVRRYWSDAHKDISGYELSVKNFEDLKGLYIDVVETAFRLSVMGLAAELIAQNGRATITTKGGGSKNIWWFEQLNNGIKNGQLKAYPTLEKAVSVLDLGLRNGVGHNSAHYDALADEIVYVKADDANLTEMRLPYTGFVDKVFAAYCAFELFAVYFQWFFVAGGGRL